MIICGINCTSLDYIICIIRFFRLCVCVFCFHFRLSTMRVEPKKTHVCPVPQRLSTQNKFSTSVLCALSYLIDTYENAPAKAMTELRIGTDANARMTTGATFHQRFNKIDAGNNITDFTSNKLIQFTHSPPVPPICLTYSKKDRQCPMTWFDKRQFHSTVK